uniref:Heparanase n=1 Tax=Acrobeloides nanus TaxID=290746 RepID=A0A914E6A2_9BILA
MLRNGTGWTEATIHSSRWNSTNAKTLFDYASSKGYEMDWELGNEPIGFTGVFKGLNLTGAQIAQDYADLKALLQTYDLYKNSLILGLSESGVLSPVEPEFLNAGGTKYISALSTHHYYFDGGRGKGTLQDFLNATILDSFILYMHRFQNFNFTPMWLGETSSASGGGAVNISDRYAGGFLYLDKLGLAALMGVDVFARQAICGAGGPYPFGNYTVLNKELRPNPDYWLSFVYKKLVGTTVYNVTTDKDDRNLRLYASSARNQNGLVLYGQWITNDSLVLDVPQLSNKQVTLYLLKEGEPGNLESATSRLNDQQILWDTHLPVANLRGNHTSLPITLPPYSQFFIVLGSDQSKSK